MAMSSFDKDMNIIQKLTDEPNDRDGLTAGELKAKFDEGGLAVKGYLNETVRPFVNTMETNTSAHAANTSNPHSVTKSQVGLGNVPNVATNDQAPTYTAAISLTALSSGEKLSVAFGKLKKAVADLISHIANTSNPHSVTYTQTGAAAASHTHGAGDITSGTLPIARGGTGATSASAAITALGGPDITGQGTVIPDNTDLNTIITPGTYKSQSAASSATMPNAPWTNAGFKLFVVQGHWIDSVKQYALADQTLYIRSTTTATHVNPTWSAWEHGAKQVHTHDTSDIASGTLPLARGGTGQTTAKNAASALLVSLESATAAFQDSTLLSTSGVTGETNTWYKRPATAMWNYIKSKAASELYVTAGQKSGTTLGTKATAEGKDTTASGKYSHAEGEQTVASGDYSYSGGLQTIANHAGQHVFGKWNVEDGTASPTALGTYVEIVGNGGAVTRKNARTLDWSGNEWIAGTLTQASDARLKDVAGEVPDLSGVRAVRFRWNELKGEHDDKDHIGYLAQDVEQIAPFLVGDDSNGYKSLDYIALLCAKVEMLERRVAELEGR